MSKLRDKPHLLVNKVVEMMDTILNNDDFWTDTAEEDAAIPPASLREWWLILNEVKHFIQKEREP